MQSPIYTDPKVLDHLSSSNQIISSTIEYELWYTIICGYLFSEVNLYI